MVKGSDDHWSVWRNTMAAAEIVLKQGKSDDPPEIARSLLILASSAANQAFSFCSVPGHWGLDFVLADKLY